MVSNTNLLKYYSKSLSDDIIISIQLFNCFSLMDKIKSFIPLDLIGNVSSIRSSQGDVYFCDLSVQVIRSRVFEKMNEGMQPFQWMGKKSYPLKNSYGFDIDEEWQKTAIEVWLKKNWKYE